MSALRIAVAVAVLAVIAGCASAPMQSGDEVYATQDAQTARPSRGGYYKDDGPGERNPDIASIADAEPRMEPLHRFANNSYRVLGRTYAPMRSIAPFRQRGLASWYGRMFHGKNTSSGEPYDMYGMTAAHPTLPIPSYARVTNLSNGKSVVVRINDRGPFHADRVIDLSWTAASKLGYIGTGSTQVEVELIQPEDFARYARRSEPTTVAAAPKPSAPGFSLISPAQAAESPGGAPVYLQLGSFSAQENADGLRVRVMSELSFLKDFVEVLQRDGTYRVQVGPYKSRADATAAAQRVRDTLQMNPVVVTR